MGGRTQRVRRVALTAAGSYRLTVSAAAGGRTVVAKPLRFRILRARRTG
jgi:hypothetical protein